LIKNTQTGSANSMHKYTSVNPLSSDDVQAINETLKGPLNEYYTLYLKNLAFKNDKPEPFFSFGITYNPGHKGLAMHKDDSTYTVNFCLRNSASGNEVVFNEMVTVPPMEDYATIHAGCLPHHTNELLEGERVNVVLWYR
jgi:hypothetical protein